MQLKAITTSPEAPYRDPLDGTGRRCVAVHPDIGMCHRRFDHADHDEWHHAMTNADGPNRQFWRWRDV